MRAEDAAGFVLAGGRSSRMGTDKALVEFRGRPLVAHALGILQGAGLRASIAGSSADRSACFEGFAPVVADAEPGLGPLGGICSALGSTAARWSVFLPVDQPLLPVELVKYLFGLARITNSTVTLTSVTGFTQTFPAVLDRSVLPALLCELHAGRRGCFSAFQSAVASMGQGISVVAAESLVEDGRVVHPEGLPVARWFLNINSADDLRIASVSMGQGFSRKLNP
jgi:molybdopterin-guanine dinucleotide biosynthesis protein A